MLHFICFNEAALLQFIYYYFVCLSMLILCAHRSEYNVFCLLYIQCQFLLAFILQDLNKKSVLTPRLIIDNNGFKS